jgi:hypothetical protein
LRFVKTDELIPEEDKQEKFGSSVHAMEVEFMKLIWLRKKVTLNSILWCLSPVLLVQNLVLIKQTKDYEAALHPPLIEEGKQLGHFVVFDMAGGRADIRVPVARTDHLLIIAMSPNCPACRASEHAWKALTDELRHRPDWRVVWISRDSIEITKRYFEAHNLPLVDTFAEPTNTAYAVLSLYSVPSMIVVDHDGVVKKTWIGRLRPEKCKAVSQFFDIPYEHLVSPIA